MERALRLAKLPTDTHPEHLKFAALRQLTPSLRLEVIEQAIINTPGVGLVVIDGVRDLMYDINCAKESTDLIGKLMEWTDKFQIHIHTVLHLNKSDDNARGHVGTELNNKAETVLQVSRSKTDDTVSEVCAAMIRAAEFDPFAFRVNDYGLPGDSKRICVHRAGQENQRPLSVQGVDRGTAPRGIRCCVRQRADKRMSQLRGGIESRICRLWTLVFQQQGQGLKDLS